MEAATSSRTKKFESEIRDFINEHEELKGHLYRRDFETGALEFLSEFDDRVQAAKRKKKKPRGIEKEFFPRMHRLLDYAFDVPKPDNFIVRGLAREFLIDKMTDIAGRLS